MHTLVLTCRILACYVPLRVHAARACLRSFIYLIHPYTQKCVSQSPKSSTSSIIFSSPAPAPHNLLQYRLNPRILSYESE